MRTTWSEPAFGSVTIMGSRFPMRCDRANIRSVHRFAVNIVDESERMFTLVANANQAHPASATVEFPGKHARFDSLPLFSGMSVTVRDEGLFFNCGLWVSFLGAKRVHPSQESPPKNIRINRRGIEMRSSLLDQAQRESPTLLCLSDLYGDDGGDDPFASRFAMQARRLVRGFSRSDRELAIDATRALIGFGPGSTPSGDDFICGFLLALGMHAASRSDASERGGTLFATAYAAELSDLLRQHTALTTDISRQFLLLACDGLFPHALVAFAHTCSATDDGDALYRDALATLAGIGHSSGYDAATGLLFGLRLYMTDDRKRGEA